MDQIILPALFGQLHNFQELKWGEDLAPNLQESHSCCSEYLLPNPLSSWAVFLFQIALKVYKKK